MHRVHDLCLVESADGAFTIYAASVKTSEPSVR
jgi:hypothetical protein